MTGNMRHPMVMRWQKVGQPSSAIATPHFYDRTSTKRPDSDQFERRRECLLTRS